MNLIPGLQVEQDLVYGFLALVFGILTLDLFVLRRGDEIPSFKTSAFWTLVYIGLAMFFCAWIWERMGPKPAMTFLTGYIVEMSLSVDNLFVFILIFGSLKIAPKYQHRVLFWGIMGALVMRAICITAGVAALSRFEWLSFIFALILVWAGIKTFKGNEDEEEKDLSERPLVRMVRKFIPIHDTYEGNRFFIREQGKLWATPLFLALILVEVSDVIFAVDSIPAVLAVSKDLFIVYTSNIFAILGLRSLYFLLSNMVTQFSQLDKAIAMILVFIGVKIGIEPWFHIPVELALGVIFSLLTFGVVASLVDQKSS